MSNPLRKMFKTDEAVEKQGVAIQYAPGVEIRVARAGGSNTRFSQMMQKLTKPHRRMIQTEMMDEGILTDIFQTVYANTVVLGWTGLTADVLTGRKEDAEKELPFNASNCIAVFKALPNLFNDIVTASTQLSLFREIEQEEDQKN